MIETEKEQEEKYYAMPGLYSGHGELRGTET